jgi:predicted dehydrogenase
MAHELAIVGAGSRGLGVYADYASRNPDQFRVVAVAEPRDHYRESCAQLHQVAPNRCWTDWRDLVQQPRLCQVAVLATQDRDHLEAALALLDLGYDLLLEKPMDIHLEGCQQLTQRARQKGALLVVAHVLRYTPYFRKLKQILDSGLLGQLVTVRHFEPVLYWHQAHSFVRGNWRNSATSAPMILAKSCHDLDMLCHLVGQDPVAVSSFGQLSHFRKEQRPVGAAARCMDCSVVCPYSAKDFYFGLLEQGQLGWPLDVITPEPCPESVARALRGGPYGRCVYDCDNDVVDHQVVNVEFAEGVTATFTMTAFAHQRARETELLGSHAQLLGDGQRIRLTPFGRPIQVDIEGALPQADGSWLWDFSHLPSHGHAGGDDGLMNFLHNCLEDRAAALRLPLPEEALRGHALCFAAEEARLQRRLVCL